MKKSEILKAAAKDAWGKFQEEIHNLLDKDANYSDFSDSFRANLEGYDVEIKFQVIGNKLQIADFPTCQALLYEVVWAIVQHRDGILKEFKLIFDSHNMDNDAYMSTFKEYLNKK